MHVFTAPLFFLAYLICVPFSVRNRLLYRAHRRRATKLLIASGAKGWELLEYKELFQSATEYLSPVQVVQETTSHEKSFLSQVDEYIHRHRPTHYLYDPRSSGARGSTAIIEAIRLLLLLARARVTPMCPSSS
jgi:hypothetical protein